MIEPVKFCAVEKHPKTRAAEIPGAGGRHVAANGSEAATASAAWSWQVVGKMLYWEADGIGGSLLDSHRRR